MKAWRIDRHGGPDVLKLEAGAPPGALPPGYARVRVEAIGLNHLDLWVRKGVPGHAFPLPITPGCDAAGVVAELGPGTERILAGSGLAAGSPVVLSPGVSCGVCEACLAGDDPLCPRYGILGEHMDGVAAESVCVPAANLVARPAALDAVTAAALPIAYLTAWTMLSPRKAFLRAGEIALIQAGGSGVSTAAIQIARLLGATVITTARGPGKVARARALGADHVIDSGSGAGSFRDEVRAICRGLGREGVQVAIDHVGGKTFEDSLRCLARGGRLAFCGATAESKVALDLKPLFFKNISILGSTMGSKADLLRVVRLAAEGRLKPVIDSTFPFERYGDAQARLESRAAFGKVVVLGPGVSAGAVA